MWHLKLRLGPQRGKAFGEVWKLKPTCFPKFPKKIWMEESTKK